MCGTHKFMNSVQVDQVATLYEISIEFKMSNMCQLSIQTSLNRQTGRLTAQRQLHVLEFFAKLRQGNEPIRSSSLVYNATNSNRIAVSTSEYHNRLGSGFTSISMMWTFKNDFDADPFNRD